MSYVAIDIGASSGRAILADVIDGKLTLKEVHRFPNLPKKDEEGHLYWDVDSLFSEILIGLKKAGEQGKVSYVGIDTWAVDYVLLNKEDRRIGKAYCYRDERGMKASKDVHKLLPFAILYSKTGMQFQPFNSIYQLYDDVKTGRMSKAKSFLMLPDYFNFLLTNIKKQEYTNGTSTGMVNALTHTWDEEIIKKLGFKRELFAPLTQPGSVVGPFSKEVEEKVGYSATVLLPATHDTASAVLAAPLEDKTPYISSGTWSLLGIEQVDAHLDEKSMKYNYTNEGSLDHTFRFQKNIMGLWMIQQVRHELHDEYSFATLAQMARENPTDKIVNVNDESFLAPESMITAMEEKTGKLSIGEMAYCIYHSLALSYKESLQEIEEMTGKHYDTLNIIGGGIYNTLLNELTLKETGKRVIVGPAEGTAIGNLLMQLYATKEISSLKEGRELVKRSFEEITEVKL